MLKDSDIMTFGMHKGKEMIDVPLWSLEPIKQENKIERCMAHTYRIMTPKEIKDNKIERKGVGVWICENCGDIAHSM